LANYRINKTNITKNFIPNKPNTCNQEKITGPEDLNGIPTEPVYSELELMRIFPPSFFWNLPVLGAVH